MWLFIIVICLPQEVVQSEEHVRIKRAADPEAFMSINELIMYRGYPSKEYEVVTDDGYVLSINRIQYGIKNQGNSVVKPVVFLQHGLLGDGSNWVTNLENNSLGFVLADAGYDVWIGNSRGNIWSRRHQNMSVHQEEFWAFSFDEMAKYDLPAVLNFILQTTGQQQLYYIGYSQGAAIAFIAFSTMPELAQKIKMFLALAPVTRIKYAKSPAMKLMSLPEKLLRVMLGKKEFLRRNKLLKKIVVPLCSYRLFSGACGNIFFLLGGYNMENMNMDRLAMYVAHSPAGTSLQNFLHWCQMTLTKDFMAYDYGSQEKNMQKYNQTTPPVYKIEDIKIPIAIWTGGNDLFIHSKDIDLLRSKISNLVSENHIPEWQHLDFIWGLDAPERMYVNIIEMMKRYA
ncbi:lipase member M-like [Sphaerodactylus townsendi]|uniref:lipase member M-like n=1 Tax=Sphaerodactylus townsendi TaxID=933632 RepID=UPI0020261F5A|nr:lipase member M-like [Sphaerodactylus townsendi]